MRISPQSVRFDDDTLWVSLSDGRTIAAPWAWFPRLLEATPEQRAHVELSHSGLHWDTLDEDMLDEDISVAGLLAVKPDLTHRVVRTKPLRRAPAGHQYNVSLPPVSTTTQRQTRIVKDKLALAFAHACQHAKQQLRARGLKLPTQGWGSAVVRNPVP